VRTKKLPPRQSQKPAPRLTNDQIAVMATPLAAFERGIEQERALR
jgi:hypothetical protein